MSKVHHTRGNHAGADFDFSPPFYPTRLYLELTMNVTFHRIDKENDQPPVVVSSQPLMADPLRIINIPM